MARQPRLKFAWLARPIDMTCVQQNTELFCHVIFDYYPRLKYNHYFKPSLSFTVLRHKILMWAFLFPVSIVGAMVPQAAGWFAKGLLFI